MNYTGWGEFYSESARITANEKSNTSSLPPRRKSYWLLKGLPPSQKEELLAAEKAPSLPEGRAIDC